MRSKIAFVSTGRLPQCPPDPAYPLGIDIDLSGGATKTCKTSLPYPAPCCGTWIVVCDDCGYGVAVTAAGRIDDPRTLKVACPGARLH